MTIRFSESIEVDGQDPVLWLKRWNPDDIEVLLKLSTVSFAELHEWMPWAAQELTREAQLEFLKTSQSAWEKGDGIDHALIVEDNRVGTWGLFRWEDEPDEWGIGYWLTRAAWGRGWATRATRALARVAFEEAGATRVWLDIDRANVRSEAVARRAGFRMVGVLTGSPATPGESGEHSRWALRREEWLALIEPRLGR